MTDFLSLEDLLTLADDLRVGPIRDVGLLAAAAYRPASQLWGSGVYPGLEDKASALLEALFRNQSLVDGNKRLGWPAAFVFLDIDDWRIDAPDNEAHDLIVAVAAGECNIGQTAASPRKWRRLA
ncbi:type II toxin-antitoxin system death-on-curing family toxin [Actinomyces capricornis]|uniref:Toxin Doc n=1 Tax=Actinomyces capricornis TaxID=2755559 RepID=A0ABN6K8P7_9ACTO|nr:alcohol dehydrogenase [Actinomyces capricornis]BDA65698.1 toxin Doc [Actinomyces capricornis]